MYYVYIHDRTQHAYILDYEQEYNGDQFIGKFDTLNEAIEMKITWFRYTRGLI